MNSENNIRRVNFIIQLLRKERNQFESNFHYHSIDPIFRGLTQHYHENERQSTESPTEY